MNARPIVVIGGGGFGREVVDVVDAIGGAGPEVFEVVGFVDDGQPDPAVWEPYGLEHLGGIDVVDGLPKEVGYVIGIGSPQVRSTLDQSLHRSGRKSPVLVHPTAVIGRAVSLGAGTIVCSHVSITNNVRLGRHVHVNLNCTIGHDAVLADYVTLSPLVAVSGNAHLSERAFIGTGVTINPGVTIGDDVVVGSNAAVIRDVESGVTVAGVPAKRIK